MQRRSLLKLGLVSGAVLALAGGAAVLLQPGLEQGRLSASARALFTSLGRAILQGTLPADAQARSRALEAMVERIDALAVNLPVPVQAELSQQAGSLSGGERQMVAMGKHALFQPGLAPTGLPGAARDCGRCLFFR